MAENSFYIAFKNKLYSTKLGFKESMPKKNFQTVRFYKKRIILSGLGFKVEAVGNLLHFSLGFSSVKTIVLPEYISNVKITKTNLILESFDKILLGNFASEICKLRELNVYKLKGLFLDGLQINKKEVKKK